LNSRFLRNGIVTLVLIVGTAALLYMFIFPGGADKPIPYADEDGAFLQLVAEGKVDRVVQRGINLEITLKETDPAGKPRVVQSRVPSEFATNVRADMAAVCQA
jgi:hypothetical protein